MKTVIVTAGCGEYRPWAARLARRAGKVNDLPCLDLSDSARWDGLTHPTWVKAQIWDLVPADVDRVVWLDVDVFPVQRMPLEDVPESAPFSAMLEPSVVPGNVPNHEMQRMPDLRAPYCNAGVFVATRETEEMFRELGKRMLDNVQGCFLDQSWLNALLGGDFNALPETWNWMIDSDDAPRGVINVHAAGLAVHEVVKVLRGLYAVEGISL